MKKYLTREELEKDYPIGTVEVRSKKIESSCACDSTLWKKFEESFVNSPYKIDEKRNENEVTVTISPSQIIYKITDHIYSSKNESWFPISESWPGMFEIANDLAILTYDMTIKEYKDYIYKDTVNKNNELHSKH